MIVLRTAIGPALSLLPERMDSPAARRMLVAIGLQESRLEYRQQIGGPAHGFWQFEAQGGVQGVLSHPSSMPHARTVCEALHYDPDRDEVYEAIVHNDVLAAAFARLLLWTDPHRLPSDSESGWDYYLRNWRPGKPHRETWDDFWHQAEGVIDGQV